MHGEQGFGGWYMGSGLYEGGVFLLPLPKPREWKITPKSPNPSQAPGTQMFQETYDPSSHWPSISSAEAGLPSRPLQTMVPRPHSLPLELPKSLTFFSFPLSFRLRLLEAVWPWASGLTSCSCISCPLIDWKCLPLTMTMATTYWASSHCQFLCWEFNIVFIKALLHPYDIYFVILVLLTRKLRLRNVKPVAGSGFELKSYSRLKVHQYYFWWSFS